MTHPTKEELHRLKNLISVHAPLLMKHLEEEARSFLDVERGPELVAAEIEMAEALIEQTYEPREGRVMKRGTVTFPTVYCVHSYYLEPFDNGLYNLATDTWHSDMGVVPEWALLKLFPLDDGEVVDTPVVSPANALMVFRKWLRSRLDKYLPKEDN